MVKADSIAKRAAQKAIESTYDGVCTVVERAMYRDEKTKITHKSEMTLVENQPCRLSFEKLNANAQSKTAAAVSQSIKLFISPKIIINAGSKIIVEQDGRKAEYSASGEPAVYAGHQEIMLELFKGWA